MSTLHHDGSGATERLPNGPQQRFHAQLVRYLPSAEEKSAAKEAKELGPFWRWVGTDELQYAYLWKAVLIELFGFTFLTVASIGAVISSFGRAPGPDAPPVIEPPALGVAVSHFFILGILILSFAPASGGHLNPMITFATVLTGHTPIARGVLYIVAHIVGSVIGAQIMKVSDS
mmetsp:Transcript_26800/g.65006  ORF Transcript_26800/g.65006 Transcript_26800/m.65006 type:complete len:174 (-) Transcript_26800:3-524(-)